MKPLHLFVAGVVVCSAIAFRMTDLTARPMHADEGVLAAKFGELLEQGHYPYDATEYHGPALAWLTYPLVKLVGVNHYAELSETHLRMVAAICGLLVVVTPLFLTDALGRWSALTAAALTAISPAMVYYSRYFIPEMLLTALTGLTLVFGYRYARTQRVQWAYAAAVSAGLMILTKETAVIAIACFFVAAAFSIRTRPSHIGHLFVAVAIVISLPLFTFGVNESWNAVQNYLHRGLQPSAHRQPWHYYASLILWRHNSGGPVWSEVLIVACAGFQIAFVIRNRHQIDRRIRFLAIYACALISVYSLIPYKTPWCVVGPLQAFALLAGTGVSLALRAVNRARRYVIAALLALLAANLAFQSWRGAFPYSSDPRNPYVYAHTGKDVFYIRETIEKLAQTHPDGRRLPLQTLSTVNLWPLPWYFRAFPNTGWWRSTNAPFRLADVILVTPEMEPALIHQIYEAPPPGQRELYTTIFDRDVELRPGVELRGYARASIVAAQ